MRDLNSSQLQPPPFGSTSVAPTTVSDACRLICESSLDPVVVFDGSACCIAANSAAASLLGYEPGEMRGLNLADHLVSESRRTPLPTAGSDGSRTWADIKAIRRKDGVVLPVEAWGTNLIGDCNSAVMLFFRGTHKRSPEVAADSASAKLSSEPRNARADFTMTRRTLLDPLAGKDGILGQSKHDAPFHAAFTAASIGMALVTIDGRFIIVNPALCAMLGYSEDELLGLTFPSITYLADLESDRELSQQIVAGAIDSYQVEKRYLRRNGEVIWGRVTVALVRDDENEPLFFVAQVQDITQYKAFGVALREAEARYRTLVEQIPAVLYVDAAETLSTPTYISPQVEQLLGFTPDEWLATTDHWTTRIHPDDRESVTSKLEAANESGNPFLLEYRVLARDGSTVWVRDQLALVRDEAGARRYWQGFMVDVTARKRVEEELRAALSSAEEANRLKSAFLSMATHELRTPLTVISGYVEILSDTARDSLSAEDQEFLDIIRTSAKTLAALVDDLLDLARIEAGRLELEVRPVDIAEAVERVCRMVRGQAAAKDIALDVSISRKLPPVAADVNRLVQILLNLLGNAIKFTEDGRVRCVVRAKRGGVEIQVIDTGVGISAEALPRIFDEFRQADAGTTRRFGGTGLGLAIAKRLVDMHSGTISAKSKVGVGSTFTLWLPTATDLLIHDDRVEVDYNPMPTRTLAPA